MLLTVHARVAQQPSMANLRLRSDRLKCYKYQFGDSFMLSMAQELFLPCRFPGQLYIILKYHLMKIDGE